MIGVRHGAAGRGGCAGEDEGMNFEGCGGSCLGKATGYQINRVESKAEAWEREADGMGVSEVGLG